MMSNEKGFLEQFKKEFRNQYGFIYHSLTDEQIQKYFDERNPMSMKQALNYFSDYVLSQGLEDGVQL